MPDVTTGNGVTVTFTGGITYTPTVVKIGGSTGKTLEALNNSNLSSTASEKYIPSDLPALEPVTLTIRYDPDDPPVIDGTTGTMAIGLPLAHTADEYSGSGFFLSDGGLDLENNVNNEVDIQWQWDGTTVPTWG